VREAVQSALAQTYQPLEVVLSDDCSPDRTFEIMKEEAEAYRGPHRVILNQNEQNVGLAENLNRAWQLTHGEFIVIQAGDDLSLPYRTETLVAVWRGPTPVDCVFSDVAIIDADDRHVTDARLGQDPHFVPKSLERAIVSGSCFIWGCSAAYSRTLFTNYGPLNANVLAEDHVLPFRALLDRGVGYCSEVLLKYRSHGANLWYGNRNKRKHSREESKRWAVSEAAVVDEWIKAWDISGRPHDALRETLIRSRRRCAYHIRAHDVCRLMVPILAARGLADGLSLRAAADLVKRHILRIG